MPINTAVVDLLAQPQEVLLPSEQAVLGGMVEGGEWRELEEWRMDKVMEEWGTGEWKTEE